MVLFGKKSRRCTGASASVQERYQLGKPPQHFSRIQRLRAVFGHGVKDTSAFYSSLGFNWLFRNHARWALGGWGWLQERDWERKRTGPHINDFQCPRL